MKLQHAIDIFPQEFGLRLDQLSSDEKILSFLSPQVLDWTAQYFGVQRDWLDGSVPYIYEPRHYVKHLKAAVDDAVELMKAGGSIDAFLLVNSNNHDLTSDQPGYACLVMRTCIKQLNAEHSIDRYVVCTQEWPLREHYLSQLKALGRLLFKYFGATIPIMQVSPVEFNKVSSGTAFPSSVIKPPYTRQNHLEDFAVLEEESAQAKDPAFAAGAIKYLMESKLDQYTQKKLAENGLSRVVLPGLEIK